MSEEKSKAVKTEPVSPKVCLVCIPPYAKYAHPTIFHTAVTAHLSTLYTAVTVHGISLSKGQCHVSLLL
jgi:hypothetical protein